MNTARMVLVWAHGSAHYEKYRYDFSVRFQYVWAVTLRNVSLLIDDGGLSSPPDLRLCLFFFPFKMIGSPNPPCLILSCKTEPNNLPVYL